MWYDKLINCFICGGGKSSVCGCCASEDDEGNEVHVDTELNNSSCFSSSCCNTIEDNSDNEEKDCEHPHRHKRKKKRRKRICRTTVHHYHTCQSCNKRIRKEITEEMIIYRQEIEGVDSDCSSSYDVDRMLKEAEFELKKKRPQQSLRMKVMKNNHKNKHAK